MANTNKFHFFRPFYSFFSLLIRTICVFLLPVPCVLNFTAFRMINFQSNNVHKFNQSISMENSIWIMNGIRNGWPSIELEINRSWSGKKNTFSFHFPNYTCNDAVFLSSIRYLVTKQHFVYAISLFGSNWKK